MSINGAYSYMTNDMRNKLGAYYESLQFRYGDPRMYALQEQQMAADAAAVQHHRVESVSDALQQAYNHKRNAIRSAHDARTAASSRVAQSRR